MPQAMPRGWPKRALVVLAIAYPVSLLVIACLLYRVGEHYWLTAAALYLPRLAFGLPLPFFVVALWWNDFRRLIWTQAVAVVVLVGPLMGFVFPQPNSGATAANTLRVLSFNVDSAHAGELSIVADIVDERPDVVIIVEAPVGKPNLATALRAKYPYVQSYSQFLAASRFRIVSTTEVARSLNFGRDRICRSVRYIIDTSLGQVAVYAVHPVSPRGAFHVYRFHGALDRLVTDRGSGVWNGQVTNMQENADQRGLQIEAASRQARTEEIPVIIAGDTNLPDLSPVLRNSFSNYQDGFSVVGWGFGYTFPAKRPFLRLDRIFAGPEFRFLGFHVGCAGASDHLCVWADLALR